MIWRLENQFFPSGEVQCKRTLDLGLRWYIDAGEASWLVKELHAGTCGSHMNSFTMEKKTLKSRYFLSTLESYYIFYVQKCHQCQAHANMIRVPPNKLHVTSSPWPFVSWGIYIMVQLNHNIQWHKFILVEINYFTKLVEATSYKSFTKKIVDKFFKSHISCWFEIR